MTVNFGTELVPPQYPIADGATTPDPGKVGAYAWSTTINSLVCWNGVAWQALGGGGVAMTQPLPILPVYEGAARPDPGVVGAMAFSSVSQVPLVWNGRVWHSASNGLPKTSGLIGLRATMTDGYTISDGERGVASDGWGIAVVWKHSHMHVVSIGNLDAVKKTGYELLIGIDSTTTGAAYLRFAAYNTLGNVMYLYLDVPGYAMHECHAAAITHDGTNLRMFGYGAAKPEGQSFGTFAPNMDDPVKVIGQTMVGVATTFAGHLLGMMTFRGKPSLAQTVQLLRDIRVAPVGDLGSVVIAGATATRRYSVAQSKATQTGLAPPVVMDEQTFADAATMRRAGSPVADAVQVSADQMIYGLLYAGTATGYSCPYSNRARGIRGGQWDGLTLAFDLRLPPYNHGPSHTLLNVRTTALNPQGFVVTLAATPTLQAYNSSGTAQLSWVKVNSTDYGQVFTGRSTFVFTRDPVDGLWKLYIDGLYTHYSSGFTLSGVFPVLQNVPMELFIGEGVSPLYGFTGGPFGMVAADIVDWNLRTRNAGRIQPLLAEKNAGEHLYDITLDVADNGGPENGAPPRILDRIGDDHFTRNEAASMHAVVPLVQHAWSYEVNPTAYSISGCADASYYESAAGAAPGNATAFWLALWLVTNAYANNEILFSATGPTNTGFYVMKSAGGLVRPVLYNTGGAAVTGPGTSYMKAQAGVPMLHVLYFTGSYIRFVVGKQVRPTYTGIALSTYQPSSGVVARIGRATLTGSGNAMTSAEVLGAAYGETQLTNNELMAYADRVNAAERMLPIPGKTRWFVDYSTDYLAAGGASPATLVDRQAGTWNFARVGSPSSALRYEHSSLM